MSTINLPRGVVKACAGIVEGVLCGQITEQVYIDAVEEAGKAVGRTFAQTAEGTRRQLLESVKLNLVNRKENPIERLIGERDLPISYITFRREQKKYCRALARELHL